MAESITRTRLMVLAHEGGDETVYDLYSTLEFYWRDRGMHPDEADRRAMLQIERFACALGLKISD